MTTKPDIAMNETEAETTQNLNSPTAQPKRIIYPEASNRFSGIVIWLGLGFVVMVFLVQHFSGYS
jgi:hypothetical protein